MRPRTAYSTHAIPASLARIWDRALIAVMVYCFTTATVFSPRRPVPCLGTVLSPGSAPALPNAKRYGRGPTYDH